MQTLNPELDRQIDALADHCCRVIKGEADSVSAHLLINALVVGGFARLSKERLQTRLEARALARCPETAIHRRAELSAITGDLQSTFEILVKQKTTNP